jgi:C-terminal processing protease CtpA/Prc
LTGFNVDTPDDVKAILDGLPSTVESVIVDLSFNGGGNVGAVLRLFGYITEEPIQYSSMNPNDGSAATYVYDSTYVAYDFNWYVMTSSVTFSAANLMASMAQEMGVATIIGTQSSGGAASIGLFVTPDGTILLRSTNNVFATVDVDGDQNRTYTSVESGVVVDYALSNTFDNAAIIALINQIEA